MIHDCILVNEGRQTRGSVLVEDERIRKIFVDPLPGILPSVDKIITGHGHYLLPGVIDDQVHFREPGLTHKGDIRSESRAAVAGGITSFMDMPNTIPQTVTQHLLEEKYALAATQSLANYSFYLGATNENIGEIIKTDPATVCGIKVFMGASTGNMLVDNPKTLAAIFEQSPLLIAVHSEDEMIIRKNLERYKAEFGDDIPVHYHPLIRSEEACYRSTLKALMLARKYNTRLHILHLSTARETDLLDRAPLTTEKKITSEVCVHHLWFDRTHYSRKGSFIKWNPAIKQVSDREALFRAVIDNTIDMVATDHAPHTRQEKSRVYTQCPSGGPMVQHSLPAMLEFWKQGMISIETIVEKMCHHPAIIFNIEERGFLREGYKADLVLVDPGNPWTVEPYNILYKCGWSPFEGTTFHSRVTHTFVNGNLVYDNGTFYEEQKGQRLMFKR